jgi:hypothetical protein
MAVANTLACYDKATITAVKSFIVQAPSKLGAASLNSKLQRPLPVTASLVQVTGPCSKLRP